MRLFARRIVPSCNAGEVQQTERIMSPADMSTVLGSRLDEFSSCRSIY